MASGARQAGHRVRFDWGPAAVEAAPSGAIVIVDILRFTTAVEAAVGAGVAVHPHPWRDPAAASLAARLDAVLADGAGGRPSLSPHDMLALEAGGRVVLPSPNGSTCAALTAGTGAVVVAACLRNAPAVASWLAATASTVTVIACGE